MAEPFHVYLRHDGVSCTFRFQINEGRGLLSLRVANRKDPEPAITFEASGLELERLRTGRFIHILPTGQRHTYALSRLPASLPPNGEWLELSAITEFGFRYVVLPGMVAEAPDIKATESLSGELVVPARSEPPREARAPRETSPSPPTRRQVPMEPALAQAALASLSREQAVSLLRTEMARIEELNLRVAELERELSASRAREDDLIDLLRSWRDRAGGA